MEFRQLEYFIAVAEELHFGRAARRMNISQPPLSMQIKNLEEELGARLFHRTSRRVELTRAGRVFLRGAREVLKKAVDTAAETRDVALGNAGRISVGFVGPAMEGGLPRALRLFRERHPRIKLALNELATSEQLKAITAGRLQVGFIRPFEHDLSGFRSEPLWQEPYTLVMRPESPLSKRKRVPLEALREEPLIMFPRSEHPGLYDRLTESFLKAGFQPRISQEARTKHTTVALVAAGIGVALVPESTARLSRQDIVHRPVDGDLPMVEISMVWSPEGGEPSVERFIQTVLESANRNTIQHTLPGHS